MLTELTSAIFESMSKHKRGEFARICGIAPAAVSVNISRKKIVVDEDDFIDDTHPINKIFVERCHARQPKSEIKPSDAVGENQALKEPSQEKTTDNEEKTRRPDRKTEVDTEKSDLYRQNFAVDLKKKQSDIGLKETKRAIDEMKLKKMSGRLIDREAAWMIFTQQFKFFSKSFHDGVEGLLTEIVKKSNLNRNAHAEMRAQLIAMINNSVDRAVDDGKKHFSALAQAESK